MTLTSSCQGSVGLTSQLFEFAQAMLKLAILSSCNLEQRVRLKAIGAPQRLKNSNPHCRGRSLDRLAAPKKIANRGSGHRHGRCIRTEM
jgi:hypothetical protein